MCKPGCNTPFGLFMDFGSQRSVGLVTVSDKKF